MQNIDYKDSLDYKRRYADDNTGLRKMRPKAWLQERNVTQLNIAEVTGFSPGYISKVLNGKTRNFSYKIPQAIAGLCKIEESQIDWFEADGYRVQQHKKYISTSQTRVHQPQKPTSPPQRKRGISQGFLNYITRT